MKKIKSGELFHCLSRFLKSKGVMLTEGAYAQGVQKGCTLLTDAINFTQTNLHRAKENMDQKLDQMRQTIHDKTAPKSQPKPPSQPAASAKTPRPRPQKKTTRKTARRS